MKPKADSAALVERLFRESGLDDYTSIPNKLPVHVHPPRGTAKLVVAGIHLFPDGFDDPDADLFLPDCGDNRVYVFGGDVTCRILHTGTFLGVAGTLTAAAIDGCSGSNCCLVARKIVAGLILERGHSFESEAIHADVAYSAQAMLEDPGDGSIKAFSEDAAELFRAELVEDGEPDVDGLLDAVRDGKPWQLAPHGAARTSAKRKKR